MAGALCAVAAVGAFPGTAHAAGYAADCARLPAHGAQPVVDAANVIPAAAESALAADLAAYHQAGHAAIVVAAVTNLGGDDVASYAKRLFDCWGVGDKGSDNGVLVLVAMTEHRTRIELGAGLAGQVGEEQLAVAVEAMTPLLRRGDVAAGLRAGAAAVADDLGAPLTGAPGGDTTPPDEVPPPVGYAVPVGITPYDSHDDSGNGLFVLVPVLMLAMAGIAIVSLVAGVAAGHGSTWRGGFPSGRHGAWGTPSLFRAGTWSSPSWSSDSSSSFGSMGSSMSSDSSSSSGSFGGGSSGGGGASGSW